MYDIVIRSYEHYEVLLEKFLESDNIKNSPQHVQEIIKNHVKDLKLTVQQTASVTRIEKSVSKALDYKRLFQNVLSIYINDLEKSKTELEKFIDDEKRKEIFDEEIKATYHTLKENFNLEKPDSDAPLMFW